MAVVLKSYVYTGRTPGPRLLVLGAVHGNEKCGPIATTRFIEQIESGAVALLKGRVTFIPVCNPQAHEKNVRFVDENLNRDLRPKEKPTTYEAQIGNALCPYLEDCDALLDLHSYTKGSEPFVITERANEQEISFGWSLGTAMLMCGWHEAQLRHPRGREQAAYSTGTIEYARAHGAMAVTLECGQNDDANAPEVAWRAIGRALVHLGMIDAAVVVPPPHDLQRRKLVFEEVFFKQEDGDFIKDWKHLDVVKKGEAIATTKSGKTITAPGDGCLIMPHRGVALGYEWFYWGRMAEGTDHATA
ncbi:MAG: succinylglutamate desuccinylase [Alphaproteobacteria bacterium]|nr:succinylglutamate desuccinylase [Alphaproteobacteria bacterium]